jgi:hypothetical protein
MQLLAFSFLPKLLELDFVPPDYQGFLVRMHDALQILSQEFALDSDWTLTACPVLINKYLKKRR